jgi:peptidoglycan/LPS O-acetylase OafA/YrhL
VIDAADVIRVFCLIIGCCFAATMFWVIRNQDTPGIAAKGFKARLFALGLGAVYVCGTEYQRIGDVVSLRLVLGVTFMVVALYSVWVPIPQLREEDPGHKLRDL